MKDKREKHKLYMRQWRKDNPEKAKKIDQKYHASHREATREYDRKWGREHRQMQTAIHNRTRKKYPEKVKAYRIVERALKQGKIKKPTTCPFCGEKIKLFAHHDDYRKPLDVRWCCRACHKGLDEALRLERGIR